MADAVLAMVLDGSQNTSDDQQSVNDSQSSVENVNDDSVTKNRKRSVVYNHFDWLDEKKKWKCRHCSKQLQKPAHGGTGNLLNHLRNLHPRKLDTPSAGSLYQHFTTRSNAVEDVQVLTKDEFEEKLIKFIMCSAQPFSLVEEVEFQDFVQYASNGNPEAELPGRKKVRELIHTKFQNEKENLLTLLKENEGKISFAVDCWTSKNGHAFQGVTASWIDSDWKLNTTVIDLTLLHGSHTGENLAAAFSAVLDEYELWNKLMSVTSDNASNMDTFFQALDRKAEEKGVIWNIAKSENYRVRCMAHIINLTCQACINTIDSSATTDDHEEGGDDDENYILNNSSSQNFVKKIRKAVVAIRSSPQRREIFSRQCEVNQMDSKNLIRDVRTRWNSTLQMLDRAIDFRIPLEATITQIRELRQIIPSDEEWKKVESLIKLLKPFRDATLLMSQEKVPTLAWITSIYEDLFKYLESYFNEDTNTTYRSRRRNQNEVEEPHPTWLQEASRAGWEKLRKYYPTSDGLVYTAATMLDPRYKDKWYAVAGWKKEWIARAKQQVRNLWQSKYKPQDNDRTDPPPTKMSTNDMQNRIFEQMRAIQKGHSYEDELTKYLKESTVPPQLLEKSADFEGVLGWWKVRQHEYPNLARMAKDLLAISGTGVPVERLFSAATDVLTHRRQSLSPNSVKECLCLKHWLKYSRRDELDRGALIFEKVLD